MRKNKVKQWAFLTAFCLLCSNIFATSGVPTATTKPIKPVTPIQGPSSTQLPNETASPNGTMGPSGTASPNETMGPNETASPNGMMGPNGTTNPNGTQGPSSTQMPQTTPGSSMNGKKVQPFILDNFKVIEATLNHFGVDSAHLADYIKQGKKLEEVLKAEKIPVKKFKKQVIEEYFKAVQQGMDDGQLTEDQANQLKNAIKETVRGWLPRK